MPRPAKEGARASRCQWQGREVRAGVTVCWGAVLYAAAKHAGGAGLGGGAGHQGPAKPASPDQRAPAWHVAAQGANSTHKAIHTWGGTGAMHKCPRRSSASQRRTALCAPAPLLPSCQLAPSEGIHCGPQQRSFRCHQTSAAALRGWAAGSSLAADQRVRAPGEVADLNGKEGSAYQVRGAWERGMAAVCSNYAGRCRS